MTRNDFSFFHPFRVRYSEIDGQGVVFNAHYLTYYDTGTTEYFRWIGWDQLADARASGIDFHVAKSVVEYKVPIRLDQEIEVGARVGRFGNSSMTIDLAIFPKGSTTLLATGELVWVYVDQTTHKSVRIPDRIRQMFAKREKHLASVDA
ncbi:MAG: acyl-CoA thioesterase [Pseudomonadota bacterium]|jgi:acyl-CoA thioester hydrolase